MWPALIAPVALLLGPKAAFFWALLLANLFSIVAGLMLHAHFARQTDRTTSFLALALVLASPGAIFFSLIYTESLFLLLSVTALAALGARRYALYSAAAFLLPLTKAIGFFILISATVHLVRHRRIRRNVWILIPPLTGYLLYFAVMAWATGDPFEGFKAQRYFANHPSIAQIFDIRGFLAAMWNLGPFIHTTEGILDRLCFAAFAIGAVACRRFNKEDFIYAIAIGTVPALSNQFLSYARFIVVCFPIFLGLSSGLLRQVRNKWVVAGILGYLTLVQIYCLNRYLNYEWAG